MQEVNGIDCQQLDNFIGSLCEQELMLFRPLPSQWMMIWAALKLSMGFVDCY